MAADRLTGLCIGFEERQGRLQVVLQGKLQYLKVFLAVAKGGLAALKCSARAFYEFLCHLLQLFASIK